jgi:hypothetical protein
MPDTSTPNYDLVKPEEGSSNDTWGEKWNDNADKLDTAIKGLADDKQDTVEFADVADVWAGADDKLIGADKIWDSVDPVDLGNITGNVTLDFDTFINAVAAMTGNVTFNGIAHVKPGSSGVFELTHSGGARTLTLNPTYFTTSGAAATVALSATGAGAKDLIGYYVLNSGKVFIGVGGLGF